MLLAACQLGLTLILIGANVVVGKLLAVALPVPVILFLRCAIALVLMAPICLVVEGGGVWRGGAAVGNILAQALLGTVIYNVALLEGLRRTGALEAGLVLAALPAVVACGAALILREHLSGRRWGAVALAALGMAALTFGRAEGIAGSLSGDGLVFVAVCAEAGWVMLTKRNAMRIGVLTSAVWMQACGAALLAPWALPSLGTAGALADPVLGGLMAFHTLTAGVVCALLWYAGMRRAPANLAGVLAVLLPATAAVLAVVVLGERFTAPLGVGLLLMLASMVLATERRSPSR